MDPKLNALSKQVGLLIDRNHRLKDTGHRLAMLALQSPSYHSGNADFKEAVDDLLAAIAKAGKEV